MYSCDVEGNIFFGWGGCVSVCVGGGTSQQGEDQSFPVGAKLAE